MMIDAHLTDGRTVFRFTTRGSVIALVKRDPEKLDESTSVRCWVDRGQGEGFAPSRLQYLRKHTIGWVEQLDNAAANAFLTEHAPDLVRKRAPAGVE